MKVYVLFLNGDDYNLLNCVHLFWLFSTVVTICQETLILENLGNVYYQNKAKPPCDYNKAVHIPIFHVDKSNSKWSWLENSMWINQIVNEVDLKIVFRVQGEFDSWLILIPIEPAELSLHQNIRKLRFHKPNANYPDQLNVV